MRTSLYDLNLFEAAWLFTAFLFATSDSTSATCVVTNAAAAGMQFPSASRVWDPPTFILAVACVLSLSIRK